MPDDPSFHPDALFGSISWVARRLGRSYDWFTRHRNEFEDAGFPKPDPLTGRYIKADVDTWVERRRQITNAAAITLRSEKGRPNLNEL